MAELGFELIPKPSFVLFFTNMQEDTEEDGTGQATPADVDHGIRISLSV